MSLLHDIDSDESEAEKERKEKENSELIQKRPERIAREERLGAEEKQFFAPFFQEGVTEAPSWLRCCRDGVLF